MRGYNNSLYISMRACLLVLCLLLVNLDGSLIVNLNQAQHASYYQWKSQYSKSYQSGEVEAYRLNLWVQNYNRIQEHNARFQRKEVTYAQAVNHFADLSKVEVAENYFAEWDDTQYTSLCTTKDAAYADAEGYFTTAVAGFYYDQLSYSSYCADAWRLSASISISYFYARPRSIKNNSALFVISAQPLFDCVRSIGTTFVSNGCFGGSIRNSFKYFATSGVILRDNYHQSTTVGTCNTSKPIVSGFNISGCVNVPTYSEQSLRNAVHVTPVSVPMNGDAAGFIYYSYGQYDALDCDPAVINHVVTITGWSTVYNLDENANVYQTYFWQGINTWGLSWGDNGTFNIVRVPNATDEGPCGMYTQAAYPE